MAGYSTINAQFRPLSYQEMLAPVVAADTEHKGIEEQQAQLQTLASQWEERLANEKDDTLRTKYKSYLDKVNEQASILSSQGLTPGVRKNLYNLKSDYTKEIIPIEEAYKKYQEELDTRKKLQMQDSSRIFEDGDVSITGFYKNPAQQFKSLSGNEVYQMAAKDFENYSKNLLSTGDWKSTAGGQYLERLRRTGATPEQITQLIAQDPKAPKELQDLYSNIVQNYTSRGNWGDTGNTKIKEYINRAASYAIGSQQSDIQNNKMWEWNMRQQEERKKAEQEALKNSTWMPVGNIVDAENSSEVNTYNNYMNLLKSLKQKGAKGATEFLNKKTNTIVYSHPTTQAYYKKMEDYVQEQQSKNPKWNPDTDSTFKILNANFEAQRNSYGKSGSKTIETTTPELKEWNALTKKYNTNNIDELTRKVEQDIKKSSSMYKKVSMKIADAKHINDFLQEQIYAGRDPKQLKSLITDVKGNSVSDEDVQDAFSKGKPGYDFMSKKLILNNPRGTVKEVLLDRGALYNVGIVIPGQRQAIRGTDYLDLLDNMFEQDPTNTDINMYLNYMFDSLESFSRDFSQKQSETSSK